MRRRELLAGLGSGVLAGVAGCSEVAGRFTGEEQTKVTSVDTDSIATGDVSLTGKPIQHFTSEHPGSIQLTLRNDGDEPQTFGGGRPGYPLVSVSGSHTDQNTGLYALTQKQDTIVPDQPAEGECWRAREEFLIGFLYYTQNLDAGKSRSGTYTLVAAPQNGPGDVACLPPGEYRFEDTLTLETTGDSSGDEFQIAFSVTLERD